MSDGADMQSRLPAMPAQRAASYAGRTEHERSKMNTNPTPHPTPPAPGADIASLLGEYAGLAQHPGEEDDRLALAIRVFEALALNDARPA